MKPHQPLKRTTFKQVMTFLTLTWIYPIVSIMWYRRTREKKFIGYGALGTIGILCMIALWFAPFPFWHAITVILMSVTYGYGMYAQLSELSRRHDERLKQQ